MEYRITPGRLEIGKFSLYYERVGAGAPLVFLHGLGKKRCSAFFYRAIAMFCAGAGSDHQHGNFSRDGILA